MFGNSKVFTMVSLEYDELRELFHAMVHVNKFGQVTGGAPLCDMTTPFYLCHLITLYIQDPWWQ